MRDLTPLPDLLEEARRIVSVAGERNVTLRLVGGLAVRVTSPSSAKPPLERGYKDVDLVGRASETRDLKKLFDSLGYAPRETFNAMQSGRRMIFNDLGNMRRVDIFLDYFEMCHKFDLRRRLSIREETLPLADLLETKLQMVQASEKDYKDMVALLADHELGQQESKDVIDVSHVVGLCSEDWGIWKTFTTSLERLVVALDDIPMAAEERRKVEARAKALFDAIQAAPKSLRWKVRARVGEKVAWYENPEADLSVVDSRF